MACAGCAAAGVIPDPDRKSRVNSPGSPGAAFCGGAAGGAIGAGAAETGAVSESALNICVKLLGASADCVAGAGCAAGAAGCDAISGAPAEGFSIDT